MKTTGLSPNLKTQSLEAFKRSQALATAQSHEQLQDSFCKLSELYASACCQLVELNHRCRELEQQADRYIESKLEKNTEKLINNSAILASSQ